MLGFGFLGLYLMPFDLRCCMSFICFRFSYCLGGLFVWAYFGLVVIELLWVY